MSLQTTINDCQKLLNYIFQNIDNIFSKQNLMNIEDFSIIGLFKSMIENANAIMVLNNNKIGDSENIITRTVLEQCIYFDYIFELKDKKHIIKRAKAMFIYQKKNSLQKQLNYLESISTNERMKLGKILNINDIKEQLEKVNKEYVSLFNSNVNHRTRKYWYNVDVTDDNKSYKNFANLAEHLAYIDSNIYSEYALISDAVHGIADLNNIYLKKKNINEKVQHLIVRNAVEMPYIQECMLSILNQEFCRLSHYYHLCKIKFISEIIAKIKINIKMKNKTTIYKW